MCTLVISNRQTMMHDALLSVQISANDWAIVQKQLSCCQIVLTVVLEGYSQFFTQYKFKAIAPLLATYKM